MTLFANVAYLLLYSDSQFPSAIPCTDVVQSQQKIKMSCFAKNSSKKLLTTLTTLYCASVL